MGEHERISHKNQDWIERKYRLSQKESQPISDGFLSWNEGLFSVGEMPFRPHVEKHIALLTKAQSDEQRSNIALQLQQNYGNRYVQRLIESMRVQPKTTINPSCEIYEQEADRFDGTVIKTATSQIQCQEFGDTSFPQEEYNPGLNNGQELITHVPTKVVKNSQSQVSKSSVIARKPGPASPKGTVKINPATKTYYTVTGSNLEEVFKQLDPVEWGGCTYNWTFDYRTKNGVTNRVDINLDLSIRLPRWKGKGWKKASAKAKAEWKRMLGCLRTHENGHAKIARSWAPKLQKRLFNQPEGDIETLWTDNLDKHESQQKKYDTDTKHGQTQGVTLDTSIK